MQNWVYPVGKTSPVRTWKVLRGSRPGFGTTTSGAPTPTSIDVGGVKFNLSAP